MRVVHNAENIRFLVDGLKRNDEVAREVKLVALKLLTQLLLPTPF